MTTTKKSPHPVDKHVGSRVRMRRMMLGMSQEKLGDALGLTFQQVQKYEKGTNRIGSSRLQQIATTLEVPVSFFFEGAPDSVAQPDTGFGTAFINAFLATADGIALAQAFTAITDATLRRKIVTLVTHLAGTASEIEQKEAA